MINYLSFPGLGIGEFEIRPVAFNLFGKNIMWYGVIITCGILLAFLYVRFRAVKFEGISADDVLDYTIFTVLLSVLGARAYYVLTNLDRYRTFYDIIAIWNGGLAIYGAIITGTVTILVISAIKRIKPTKMLDATALGVMIGQIIGRWGNFTNAEAFGCETDLPWRMGIRNAYHPETIYVHPTFLYESLWNLLGFLILNALYKKKKFDGQVTLMYFIWYGFGRMFIEQLRTDSLYVGPFRISQVVGFLSFFLGMILLIVFLFRAERKERALEAAAEEAASGEDGPAEAETGEEGSEKAESSEAVSEEAASAEAASEKEEAAKAESAKAQPAKAKPKAGKSKSKKSKGKKG